MASEPVLSREVCHLVSRYAKYMGELERIGARLTGNLTSLVVKLVILTMVSVVSVQLIWKGIGVGKRSLSR